METVFLSLLNRSMAAGWLILAVVALRLPLKKAPRWITAALWGLVAVRLICPFSFESRFSLLPRADAIPPEALTAKHPAMGSGSSFLDPSLSERLTPQEIASVNPLQVLLFAASLLWIAGMLSCFFTLSSALCVLAAGCGRPSGCGTICGSATIFRPPLSVVCCVPASICPPP